MRLSEWMVRNKIKPDKGLCMTLGTDGFKPDRDHLMSVSYFEHGRGMETVYINGADPSKVQEYTGVTEPYYKERCVGEPRALELIKPAVDKSEFLVVYNSPFFTSWVKDRYPFILEKPILDLTAYYRMSDKGETIPEDIDNIDELTSRMMSATVCMRRGHAFEDYVKRLSIIDDGFERPELENKVLKLHLLYVTATCIH